MRLLLDECVDQRLLNLISGHDIATVAYMGWSGVKNGQLLRLAATAGFDARLTTDGSIQHQQNPDTLPLGVLWLHAKSNDLDDLRPLIPSLLAALRTFVPRAFRNVP